MIFEGTKLSDLSKASILIILAGFLVVGGSFYFFFELAEQVLEDEKFLIDQIATDVVQLINVPWMATAMGWITEAGSVTLLTIGSFLLLVYLLFFSSFSRWVSVYFLVNMLGISALTKLLKLLFERKRPEVLDQYDGTGFSFPSGHSTGSLVFYGFIIYVITISHLGRKWKWIINISLGLFIFSIGFSRVYLGVHYFTDILAGFSFGLAWLFICISALEITLWHQRRRQLKQK